jgi:beta-lactamase regulating signal transducer with metallopeptidase domain/ankyrin repeat protein
MPVATWTILGPQAQSSASPTPSILGLPDVEARASLGLTSHPDATAESPGNADIQWKDKLKRVANASLLYVVGLWFGGVLILTLRLTLGWTLMRWLCLSGLPIQDSLCRERFRNLLGRMQVGVPVRLLQSALVEVPTLIGWLRPTILVPASVFIGLTPDQLEAILAHELAHVRRYDYLVNLFQTIIETILFYHPAVWWISRKLREERENCCDDIALEVMQDRLVYVSALAQLEQGRAMPLALTASGGSLLQRIRRIVGANDRKVSAWPLWVLIIGILSVVCLTRTNATETPDTTKPSAQPVIDKSDPSLVNKSGNFGSPLNSSVDLILTLVEIDEKACRQNAAAMDDAVLRGDQHFFENRNDAFVYATDSIKFPTQKGWYSMGEVISYIASAKTAQQNGKPFTTLTASSVFLGFNGDFVFSHQPGAVLVDSSFQQTELTGYEKLDLDPGIPPEDARVPQFHITTAVDKNWKIEMGKTHGLWIGATCGQLRLISRIGKERVGIDEMIKAKTPSRSAIFMTPLADGLAPQIQPSSPAQAPPQATALPPGPTAAEMKAVEDSQTPLMKALHSRQYDTARALLAQGADCDATDKMGSGALAFLISYSGNDGQFPIDILQTILARTRDPNPPVPSEFSTPPASDPLLEVAFMSAAYSNGPELMADHRQVVKLLIAHGARFTGASDDVQALLQAAALGDLPTLQQLVTKGTSPSAADGNGWTPLLISIALENNAAANWLIDHGANVSAITRRGADDPLLYATAHGDDALVEKLIAKGAKPVLRGGDLWRAIDRNDQRLFDDLINAGADPKQESEGYGSAGGKSWRQISSDSLFICIAKGQTAMALTLIDKGVDPEPKNVFGNRNFAYWAVYHDRPEILQALLDHGANPLLKDHTGESPLSLAQKSHPDLVPMLQAAIKIAPKSETSTHLPDPASNAGDSAVQAKETDPDEWTIRNLKVSDMPLTELAQKLTAMTKADDPKGVGVAIDVKVPLGETPLKITYGYTVMADVNQTHLRCDSLCIKPLLA